MSRTTDLLLEVEILEARTSGDEENCPDCGRALSDDGLCDNENCDDYAYDKEEDEEE